MPEMTIVGGKRGAGKTIGLIQAAYKNKGAIIVRSLEERARIYKEMEKSNIPRNAVKVLTVHMVYDGNLRGYTNPVYIDDAADLLAMILEWHGVKNIKAMSMRCENLQAASEFFVNALQQEHSEPTPELSASIKGFFDGEQIK